MLLWRLLPILGQSTIDFKYSIQENETLGILMPVFKENEMDEWSEFPRGRSITGSMTSAKLVRKKSKVCKVKCCNTMAIEKAGSNFGKLNLTKTMSWFNLK